MSQSNLCLSVTSDRSVSGLSEITSSDRQSLKYFVLLIRSVLFVLPIIYGLDTIRRDEKMARKVLS